jgi:hypothetical protein
MTRSLGLLVILGTGWLAIPAPAAAAEELEAKARALVAALEKEDYAAAVKDFDDTMKKALPTEKLGEVWKGIVKQVGALRKTGKVQKEKVQKYDVVWVSCEFEKANLWTRAVFDEGQKVAGLSFRPFGPAGEYRPPAYVQRERFRESEVTIGSGEWSLPGTVALPVGDGPFPGVVLVHGSGPHDRDETIGPNRPFRDLAWGLASRGIAVLRYEKRTKAHGAKLAAAKDRITIKEEVLDDALAAAAVLRKTKNVDPKKVFLLGHSLGGMVAPRAAEADPELAGIILLAGATRPLEDVLIEQVEYLLSLDPSPSAEAKAQVAKIKEQVARLKGPGLPADTPASELPLGQSLAYWQSLRELQPAQTAARIKQPILVLQGERDYQVTMDDFAEWKKALSGRKDVVLKSYPKLNHLFAEGVGKARPEEYQKEGHVAAAVIEEIAAWLK